jgi:peptidoglycan/LPS O-acetylase OafA/YrhL
LSGYLITDLLLGQRSATGSLELGQFWIRRARRLLPAVFLMIAVVVAWVTLLEPSRLPALRGDVIAATFYVSNWWNIIREASYFARFGPPPPLEHLWSLAVEEQFYLIWPWFLWIVLLFTRKRPALAGLTLTSLTLVGAAISAIAMWVIYQPGVDPTRVYEGTDTRAFGLLIGAALAMVWPSRRLRADFITVPGRIGLDGVGLVGLVVIGLLIWRTSQYSPFLYHGGIVVLSVATAATVAAMVHPASLLGVAVGWAPLRWLGVRSYGIYLWHWPIIVLTAPGLDQKPSLSLQVAQVAATIVVAALSWRFFEEPIRRGALGRLWARTRSREWFTRRAPDRTRSQRRRRFATRAVVLVALGVLVVDGVGLAGMVGPKADSGGMTASSEKTPKDPGVSTHHTAAPPATTPEPTASETAKEPTQHPERESSKQKSSEDASSNMSSCKSIVYIGDSTSEGMVLPSYLPKAGQRLGAQYERVGATSQYFEISGARSIVETISPSQANGYELARQFKAQGYDGCWMIGLGTNDAADVYVGSAVGLEARVGRMMRVIGDQPVMWTTVKSLLTSGPYANTNMQDWNRTVVDACEQYPNMRVFDWASQVEDDWFLTDGTHYTPEGSRHRAHMSATALAHGFPASGEKDGSSCVVE